VGYLASNDAGYLNGQIIGVTNDSLRLWSSYSVVKTLYFDGEITPEDLRVRFPETLGDGLSNPVPDLPPLPDEA
jgi:hypothetical protein